MEMSGKVIQEAGGPRFVPGDSPESRLMLTTTQMQEARAPQVVDLGPYVGQAIGFTYQVADSSWVWGVRMDSIRIGAPK